MQVSDLRCSVRSGHQPTWHAWEKASLLQLMQWHRGTCISIASTPERKVALRSVYLPYPQPLLDSLEAVAKTQLTCEKEGLSSAPPNCRPHPTPSTPYYCAISSHCPSPTWLSRAVPTPSTLPFKFSSHQFPNNPRPGTFPSADGRETRSTSRPRLTS